MIVQHIRGNEGILAIVELGEGDLARMRGLDFGVRLLFLTRALDGPQLFFSEDDE